MTTPPKADKRPYPITMHGDTRVDDYYWLRDDERTDADVLDYLQAENAFTEAVLKPQQPLRETLYQEMVSRIPPQEESVPYIRNGYRYQTRFERAMSTRSMCANRFGLIALGKHFWMVTSVLRIASFIL